MLDEPSMEVQPEKKTRQKPTIRQRRAVKAIVENGGNVSKAMRDVGYSAATAENPNKLTDSDGFRTLLETNMPLQKLMEVGADGLDAYETRGKNGEIQVPDFRTRHQYYETALKLHGKLRPESMDLQVNIIIPVIVKRRDPENHTA